MAVTECRCIACNCNARMRWMRWMRRMRRHSASAAITIVRDWLWAPQPMSPLRKHSPSRTLRSAVANIRKGGYP
ncbi:hypothetical protein NY96_26160 [Xanthomonas citri pv. fuscans]|nr:hypothetical protein NY96_26160 [Xanthomonas citri pv. fuscans]